MQKWQIHKSQHGRFISHNLAKHSEHMLKYWYNR